MKLKQLLTKSLLAAATLCLGQSAWAAVGDNIYSNDFSTKDQTDFATWTATSKKPSGYSYAQIGRAGTFSIATGALVNTAETTKKNSNCNNASVGVFNEAIMTTTAATNYVLSFDITFNILRHTAASSIFEISDESKQVLICLYAKHSIESSTAGSTLYGYIVGGNNGFQVKEASVTDGKAANAEGTFGDGTQHELASVSETTGSKTFHVVFDAKVAGKATLTITEGETTLVDAVEYNIAANKSLKYMYFNNHNTGTNTDSPTAQQNTSSALDNFSIVEGAASSDVADYTVKYVATINAVETEIKTSAVRNGFKGATVELEAADKNSIVYNDVKYLYSSDNASTTTIAYDGSSVVKVQFVQAQTYTYNVTDNFGTQWASGSAFEGDNVEYYISQFVFSNNRFYKTPSANVGSVNSLGVGTIPSISANADVTVTYTEEENTNVVYFSEAENISGITVKEDNYTRGRMSNGKAGYFSSQTAFTTLPPGKYTLTSATRSGTTSFYTGEVGSGTEILTLSSSGSVVTTTSDEFEITAPTGVYTNKGGTSTYFDYVTIRKTGDATNLSATITPTGYATFSSPYALDFSGDIENLDAAYYASAVAQGSVTMTELKQTVPAETGLFLKGTPNATVTIPVVAFGTDIEGTNYLKPNTASSTITASTENTYHYVFAYTTSDNSNPGFFNLGSDVTLGAGKAYIETTTDIKPTTPATPAKVDFLLADGGLTGVKNIDASSNINANIGKMYNLGGQLVNEGYKGIVIMNGKKVVK